MSFCQAINNMTTTENGAVTYKSSNNPLVDLFFQGAALRSRPQDYIQLFQKAFDEDPEQALRIVMYQRDCRSGQGERNVFRTLLHYIGTSNSTNDCKIQNWLKDNLELIPYYGRWDDLLVLLDGRLSNTVIYFLDEQLDRDCEDMIEGRPISLLAKWMPSINTSSKSTVALAQKICSKLGISHKGYRKLLAKLRAYIDVVEVKMSSNNWTDIKYTEVPSKASLNYRKAFARHDADRYAKYLEGVQAGKAKINAKTLYPYEILEKLWNSHNTDDITALNLMWKALPDYVPDFCGLVIADTSGSMSGRPMAVSVSLAMYIAERNKNEAWKDYFISFSADPKMHKITGTNLNDRTKSVRLGDVANTNLQRVFDLVLDRAIMEGVSKEDMPKMLIIVSDMEWDKSQQHYGDGCTLTNHEAIKQRYADKGYECPTLVYWNVNSRQENTPVKFTETGVVLLSGCSPTVFKYCLGDCQTPMDMVEQITNSERYARICYN